MKKTLEELEGKVWPSLTEYPTPMVQKCHELRKIPISELKHEELRLLLTQNIGNEFLVPLAINLLSENILIETGYFSGDLLESVIKSDISFWKTNSEMLEKVRSMIRYYIDDIKESNEIDENAKIDILDAIKKFEALNF